eukprot:8553858-Pyramimonas_sp.AAC.1
MSLARCFAATEEFYSPPNVSECFRMFPNVSECFRRRPQVRPGPADGPPKGSLRLRPLGEIKC